MDATRAAGARRGAPWATWLASSLWAVLDLITLVVVLVQVDAADRPGTLWWSGGHVHNATSESIRVVPIAFLEGEDGEARLGLVPHLDRVDAFGFAREFAPVEIAPGASARIATREPNGTSLPVSLLVERDGGTWGRQLGRWELVGPGYERSTVRIADLGALDEATAAELAVLRDADRRRRPTRETLWLVLALVLPLRLLASLVAWPRLPSWLRTGRRELVILLPVVGLIGFGLLGPGRGYVCFLVTLAVSAVLLVTLVRSQAPIRRSTDR